MTKQFGRYLLFDKIAVGGMAEIYLARHQGVEGFEKLVVIKRIRAHLSDQKNFVNMFLDEAKLAANLNHPNIVQIFDLGHVEGSFFIAMEYVPGKDMSRVIPKSKNLGIPFPVEYALKIASNVCEGLHYAHNKGDTFGNPLKIVHRDISPENIIVSYEGAVKILDFGIAKATSQIGQTKAGEVKGKISYMSPEQCRGQVLDHRSDIFSLGIVLYEWITGLKLFAGDNEAAILQSIIHGRIYPPSYFVPDVPKSVEEILMRALAKDREKRYRTAWDMQYDIDQFLSQHEFTPSNVHLSNFIKQLFKDEIPKERENMQNILEKNELTDSEIQQMVVLQNGFEDTQPKAEVVSSRPSDTEKKRRSKNLKTKEYELSLNEEEIQKLHTVAKKHHLSSEQLVTEIVRNHLKFV